MNLRDFSEVSTNIFKETPEGYLVGKVCVTGAGVFTYLDDSNRRIARLRSRDEVEKATVSLNNKPVTFNHPSEDVNPDNVKKYQVGFSANDAEFDGLNNFVTLTITDRNAIEAIKRGELKAISCGYNTKLIGESGNWQGVEYDERMQDIVYNHIALVKAGRAGDGVIFRVGDSVDFEKFFNIGEDKMKKLVIDSVQYEVDSAVIDHIQSLQKENDELKANAKDSAEKLETLTGERDSAIAEVEQLKAKAMDETAFNDAVDAKVALIAKASELGAEVKAQDSVDTIKKAVIAKAYSNLDLSEKSAQYIDACYDMAVLALSQVKTESALDSSAKDEKAVDSVEDAYKKMDELYK